MKKKKTVRKVLMIIGILPYVIPVLLGFYRMSIESWTMIDWLVMYSFLFWPTYVLGAILILAGLLYEPKEKGRGRGKQDQVNDER